MRANLCLTALLFLSLSTACSNSGSIPREQYGHELIEAFCESSVRCGAAHSQATCVEWYSQKRNGMIETAGKSPEDSPNVRYDATAAWRWVEWWRDLSCDYSEGPTCDDCFVWVGTLERGDACRFSQECETGLYCETSDACPGVCADRKPLGEAASSAQACESGLIRDGVCAERRVLGEDDACDPSDFWSSNCEPGTACIGGRCITPPGKGEPCSGICGEWGLFCDASGTCAPKLSDGDACDAHRGSYTGCKDVLFCEQLDPEAPGHCRLPYSEGEPCKAGPICWDESLRCVGIEDPEVPTCRPARRDCESCNDFEDCEPGLTCDPTVNQCRRGTVIKNPSATECDLGSSDIIVFHQGDPNYVCP